MAFIQAELGRVVQLNGNKKCGLEMIKKAINICEMHMDNATCKTKNIYVAIKYAQLLAAIGTVLRYEDPPKLDEALQHLEKALALQDFTLDKRSIYRIRTLYYMGNVYQEKKDTDKAKEKMMQSLKLIEGVDPSHPLKASICTALGQLLQDEEAEKYVKEAFHLRRKKLSSEAHWKMAFAYQSVGKLLMLREGSTIEAFNHFLDANNMFARLIERESLEKEKWLDSRPSSAPDYGIDIIDSWRKEKEFIEKQMRSLVK